MLKIFARRSEEHHGQAVRVMATLGDVGSNARVTYVMIEVPSIELAARFAREGLRLVRRWHEKYLVSLAYTTGELADRERRAGLLRAARRETTATHMKRGYPTRADINDVARWIQIGVSDKWREAACDGDFELRARYESDTQWLKDLVERLSRLRHDGIHRERYYTSVGAELNMLMCGEYDYALGMYECRKMTNTYWRLMKAWIRGRVNYTRAAANLYDIWNHAQDARERARAHYERCAQEEMQAQAYEQAQG